MHGQLLREVPVQVVSSCRLERSASSTQSENLMLELSCSEELVVLSIKVGKKVLSPLSLLMRSCWRL